MHAILSQRRKWTPLSESDLILFYFILNYFILLFYLKKVRFIESKVGATAKVGSACSGAQRIRRSAKSSLGTFLNLLPKE